MMSSNGGGWAGIVLLAAFANNFICGGILQSFGVLFSELLDTFEAGNALTSWIGSAFVGVMLGSGPLAAILCNRFGCRSVVMLGALLASAGGIAAAFARTVFMLILSVGLMMGIGFGLIFCPTVVITNLYFTKNRALAAGFVACGAGVGTFAFAPLTAYLIETYMWTGTFLIYGALLLNGLVVGATFRPPATGPQKPIPVASEDQGHTRHSIRRLSGVGLLKNPAFLVLSFSSFFTNLGIDVAPMFVPRWARDFEVAKQDAAWLISVWGIASIVGRLFLGFVCNYSRVRVHRLWVYTTCMLCCGVVFCCSPFIVSYFWLLPFTAMAGFLLSAHLVLISVILVDMLGVDRLASAFGWLLVFQGAGAVIGPPLAGLVADSTNSYAFSFVYAGGAIFASGALLFMIPACERDH